MDQQSWLTERFEENRPRLRGVAYRMLGSLSEAEDAVQEAWLRLNRIDTATVENLGGWLTTVVSRVCLDMLRSRKSRREEPIDAQVTEPSVVRGEGADPEGEAVLADSVGVALLVVLDTLTPAERLAFVLHDLFAHAVRRDRFHRGTVAGRGKAAREPRAPARARLASAIGRRQGSSARSGGGVSEGGARRRPRGPPRRARSGRRPSHRWPRHASHAPAADAGKARELRGASTWAKQFIALSRGLRFVQPALINGSVGLILAPRGKLSRALTFTFTDAKITRVEVIGDPARLRELDIAVLAIDARSRDNRRSVR